MTGSVSPDALGSLGRTIVILTREDLARLPVSTPIDALRLVPSVEVRERGPRGVQADFAIRGAGFGQALVLVNGARLNDAQSGHHNGDVPVSLLDVERIEVLLGGGASVHGADAVGGAINVITRRAGPRFAADVAFGQHDLVEAAASVSLAARPVEHVFTGEFNRSTGFAPDRDHDVKLARYQGSLGARTSVSVAYLDKEFGAAGFYGPSPSREWTDQTLVSAEHRFAPRGDSLLSIDGAYRSHGDHFVYDWRRPELSDNRHRTHAVSANGRWRTALGAADAALGRRPPAAATRSTRPRSASAYVLARRRRRRAAAGPRIAAWSCSLASASIATTASAPPGARRSRRAAGSCRTCAGGPRPAAPSASRPTPSSTTAIRTTRRRGSSCPSGRGRPTPASTPSPAAGRPASPPSVAGTPTSSTGSAAVPTERWQTTNIRDVDTRGIEAGLSRRVGVGLMERPLHRPARRRPDAGAALEVRARLRAARAVGVGRDHVAADRSRLARHLHAPRRRPGVLGRRPAGRPRASAGPRSTPTSPTPSIGPTRKSGASTCPAAGSRSGCGSASVPAGCASPNAAVASARPTCGKLDEGGRRPTRHAKGSRERVSSAGGSRRSADRSSPSRRLAAAACGAAPDGVGAGARAGDRSPSRPRRPCSGACGSGARARPPAGRGPPTRRRARRQHRRRLRPAPRGILPGPAPGADRPRGALVRGRQRRRLGRHLGRRPAPARLGARRRRPGPDRRARRQRRPARPAARRAAQEPHRHRPRAPAHGTSPCCCAAWKRRQTSGPAYTTAFREAFSAVAREEHVPFVRFVLDKVAGVESLNQEDGIHPNVQGARIVADTVWPALQPAARRRRRALMITLRGVSKTVSSGGRPLTILHPLDLHVAGRRAPRHRRAVGQRQVDADRPDGRARPADERRDPDRRHRHHQARRGRAGAPARPRHRLRLPVLPPGAVADRVRERARADGDRRPPRRDRARPRRCSTRSA